MEGIEDGEAVTFPTGTAVEDTKLEIAFEKAGDKKVMDAFVERV